MAEVEIKQWGNSLGVILPLEELKELGLERGDTVDIDIVGKKMVDGFGIAKGARPFREEQEEHRAFWP